MPERPCGLVARVRHEGHKSGTFNSLRYSMLADCPATTFSAAYNAAMSVGQFRKQLQILVVDVKRVWPVSIDEDRIFFGSLRFGLSPPRLAILSKFCHESFCSKKMLVGKPNRGIGIRESEAPIVYDRAACRKIPFSPPRPAKRVLSVGRKIFPRYFLKVVSSAGRQ